MFVYKILTLTILMVLQNIHGMPQRETARFLCAAVVNCNKNQKCSIDESTGNATCVCKDGLKIRYPK